MRTVTGNVTVPAGQKLWVHDTVTGDLTVEPEGAAAVWGSASVGGNVVANGPAAMFGTVHGSITGEQLIDVDAPLGEGYELTAQRRAIQRQVPPQPRPPTPKPGWPQAPPARPEPGPGLDL